MMIDNWLCSGEIAYRNNYKHICPDEKKLVMVQGNNPVDYQLKSAKTAQIGRWYRLRTFFEIN